MQFPVSHIKGKISIASSDTNTIQYYTPKELLSEIEKFEEEFGMKLFNDSLWVYVSENESRPIVFGNYCEISVVQGRIIEHYQFDSLEEAIEFGLSFQ